MKKLKELRKGKGWSQMELAKRSGVSQSFINYLESGTKQPTLTTLNKLSSALGISVSKLLSENGEQAVAKEVV